jgi:hypothetical protein
MGPSNFDSRFLMYHGICLKTKKIRDNLGPVSACWRGLFSGLSGLLTSNYIRLKTPGDFDQPSVGTSGLELPNWGGGFSTTANFVTKAVV